MSTQLEADLSQLLRVLAESLDISESRYQKAEERYQAVGKWLGRNGSIFASANPEIYPQGSFRLGTVIKPVSDSEDYDIDLVCQITLRKDQITQRQLISTAMAPNDPSVTRRSVPCDCRQMQRPHHTAVAQSDSVAANPIRPCSAAISSNSLLA